MTIWYRADTHFGHDNIIKYCNRPFTSAAQMDAALMENLRAKVGPEDTLWIVGDFALVQSIHLMNLSSLRPAGAFPKT